MTGLKPFLAVFAILLGYVSCESVPITEDLKNAFLEGHNEYRRNEGASNMNELVWSDKLSKITSDWISRCNFDHMMKEWGENLWYSSMVKDMGTGIQEGLKDWFDEKFLGGDSYSCGMRCHYTQLVWAKTKEVGCAIEKCGSLWAFGSSVKDATYIACFYSPKGNMNGESTYEIGKACSKCGKGQKCEKELCTGEAEAEPVVCEDKKTECKDWASFGECKKNKKFMDKECAQSCGACEGGNGKVQLECSDINKDCPDWAGRGECQKNPKYMNAECRKSCKQC